MEYMAYPDTVISLNHLEFSIILRSDFVYLNLEYQGKRFVTIQANFCVEKRRYLGCGDRDAASEIC
jgi:hypothetical protein